MNADIILRRFPRVSRFTFSLALALASIFALESEFHRVFSPHGLWDFGAFVASGRAAVQGLDPYGIYPPLTPHVVFPGFASWNPNLNPPISTLLFQVFDIADPARSLAVWNWISIACYLTVAVLVILRYARGVEAALLFVWAVGLAGFLDTLYLGQIYTPLVLATVVAWLFLDRGNPIAAGFLIGLLISMKPNFLVWPVLLFFAGHRMPSLVSMATAAAVAAIPLLIFGPHIYRDWLTLVASDGDRAVFLTNGSLSGLAARIGLDAAGPVLSGLLLVGLAAWAFSVKPRILDVSGLALLAALLASPLGWVHYTLFLLPVLICHRDRLWCFIASLALTVPVPYVLSQFGKPEWMQLTLGSVYGWALVLLFCGLAYYVRKRRALSVTEAGERPANLSYPQSGGNAP